MLDGGYGNILQKRNSDLKTSMDARRSHNITTDPHRSNDVSKLVMNITSCENREPAAGNKKRRLESRLSMSSGQLAPAAPFASRMRNNRQTLDE